MHRFLLAPCLTLRVHSNQSALSLAEVNISGGILEAACTSRQEGFLHAVLATYPRDSRSGFASGISTLITKQMGWSEATTKRVQTQPSWATFTN